MKHTYINFEYYSKFEPVDWDKITLKANIGRTIIYLLRRNYDRYRGYYSVDFGTIEKIYRNRIIFTSGSEAYIPDIIDCGIKKTEL